MEQVIETKEAPLSDLDALLIVALIKARNAAKDAGRTELSDELDDIKERVRRG